MVRGHKTINSHTDARLTKGSQKVLQALAKVKNLATAQDIHAQLRQHGEDAPGLTTVYRSLESLVTIGMVQAVELGDGEKRFELVEPGEHHHHLVCERCKESVHLDQCIVEDIETAVRTKYGFEITTHILELFGVCKKCRK
jgi:Fur family ferric uptake transcriptional regulator